MRLPPADYTPPVERWAKLEGINHANGEICSSFSVDLANIQYLYESGLEQKYYDSLLVVESLKNPTAILAGLKRENFNEGLCYCSAPKLRLVSDDDAERVPFPEGMIFCVYVSPKPDGSFVVMDWELREKHETATGIPCKTEQDFGRIAWPLK